MTQTADRNTIELECWSWTKLVVAAAVEQVTGSVLHITQEQSFGRYSSEEGHLPYKLLLLVLRVRLLSLLDEYFISQTNFSTGRILLCLFENNS